MNQQMTGIYRPTMKVKAKKHLKQTEFVSIEVDNPYAQASDRGKASARQKVSHRTSDNPLLTMLARGAINPAQYRAGQKYQTAWLASTGQSGQGMDYAKQRVDTSLAPMSVTEWQLQAADIIRNAARELEHKGVNEKGKGEAALRMRKVAGEGLSVTQYCKSVRGLKSHRSISKQNGFLKEDLTVLAKFWGYER